MKIMNPMRHGARHPSLGDYVGGCPLEDNYKLVNDHPFKYSSQLCNHKQLANNEKNLIKYRSSVSTMKFDGNLELNKQSPSTKMNKEQFFIRV